MSDVSGGAAGSAMGSAIDGAMSNAMSNVLRIGLSRRAVTVVRTSGWLRTRTELIADHHFPAHADPLDQLTTELGGVLADPRCAGARLRIVLADEWMRSWLVTPPQNVLRLEDCVVAAQARFQALFGEAVAEWQMQADWDCVHPFLVCAVQQRLLQGLQDVARLHKQVLVEVAPQFVVAWNRWSAQLGADAWFGVMHEGALTIGALAPHGLRALREIQLSEPAIRDQRQLQLLLKREAVRLNVVAPTAIRLCGEIPLHWVMQTIDGLAFSRLDRERPAPNLPRSAGLSLALTGLR
ncbi:MAG: hypothetical protein WCK07_08740 [Betaproteobacteria bacterium]